MSIHSERTAAYRRKRATFLRDHPVCWLCGHDGADEVDHAIPRSRDKRSGVENWRPAHGSRGCPTCRRKCNQVRGDRAPRPYAQEPASYPVGQW